MFDRDIEKPREVVIIGFITLFAGALRFFRIGFENLWLDENWSLLFASNKIPEIISVVATLDVHPPTYYILLHSWMSIFGPSELALKSLSVLFGILSIPLFYLLARKFFKFKDATIATILLALSSYAVEYSQEVRMYSMLVLTTIFCYYAFLDFLEDSNIKTQSIYLFSVLILIYTHIMGLTVIAAQGIQFLLRNYNNRDYNEIVDWTKMQVIAGIAFLPWFWIVINQANKLLQKEQPNIGFEQAFGVPFYLSGGLPTVVIFGILGILATVYHFRNYISTKISPKELWLKILEDGSSSEGNFLIALIWFSVPLALQLSFVPMIPRTFDYRHFIMCLPPLLIIVNYGLEDIKKYSSKINIKHIYYLALMITFASMTFSLANYYTTSDNPNWEEGVKYFESQADDNAIIVFDASMVQRQFTYYAENDSYRIYGYNGTHPLLETQKKWPGIQTFQNQTIWLFTSHSRNKQDFLSKSKQTHNIEISKNYNGLEIRKFSPQ
jgi:uncharacterized membrane protein